MKIIQVITLFDDIYGAQKHVYDLSVGLKDRGHQVLIVTGKKGKIAQISESVGLKVQEIKSLKRQISTISEVCFLISFIKLVKLEKPDYIHSHSSKAGFLVRIVCFFLSVPNTFTAHGWSFEDGVPFLKRNLFRSLETLVGFISNKIIAVSEFGRSFAIRLNIAGSDKIDAIHYGVHTPLFSVENKVYSLTGNIRLIMVAGFREQKDHFTLFNALREIKDKSWEIYLVGNGPMENYFKSLSIEFGISDKCHFVGAITDVSEYYKKADVKLLITNWEGLPISILEALSYGLPIIATNVGGINEEVVNNWNGFLVGRKSVDDLINSLIFIIENRDRLKEFGSNSRALFEQKFKIERMVDNIETHYFAKIQ